MTTLFDKNLLPEFESVKDDDEQILWTEKPKLLPYTITGLGLGLGALFFIGFYYAATKTVKNEDGTTGTTNWLLVAFPLGIFLWQFLKKLLSYNNTRYAYSNKRVMMRTGFIGTD